ncbi:hypothetical protein [uncultured Lacinutrix sp.]|uniref:hypothetical protein n=1 Tax=uncultured Lacinutrix sp. TaxID=574032 RepID=UPI00260684B4|nr:hypothetical protein [uncultured Lacinutrix sp.]
MENRTNFDLNKNIEIWKSKLSKNSKMTLDNINELESHLLDEIHELQLLGLSIEESLIIAKERIGNVKDLTTEFGKVNDGFYFRNRIIPYLKGILLFFAFITISNFLTQLSIVIAHKFGVENYNLNFISISILLLMTLGLLIVVYFQYKNRISFIKKLTSIPMLSILIIVGKLMEYVSSNTLSGSVGFSESGSIYLTLNIYSLIIGIFIIIISCIVFYSTKKENKIKILE